MKGNNYFSIQYHQHSAWWHATHQDYVPKQLEHYTMLCTVNILCCIITACSSVLCMLPQKGSKYELALCVVVHAYDPNIWEKVV